MEMITKMLAGMSGTVNRSECSQGGNGGGDDAIPTPRAPEKVTLCNNCNKVVMYKAADCYSLESNAANRPDCYQTK